MCMKPWSCQAVSRFALMPLPRYSSRPVICNVITLTFKTDLFEEYFKIYTLIVMARYIVSYQISRY